MYEIVELNERELPEYKGKIIQVISSAKRDVEVRRDYLNLPHYSLMWVLTCLVEVEK